MGPISAVSGRQAVSSLAAGLHAPSGPGGFLSVCHSARIRHRTSSPSEAEIINKEIFVTDDHSNGFECRFGLSFRVEKYGSFPSRRAYCWNAHGGVLGGSRALLMRCPFGVDLACH